jgi:hypothetical protein
LPGISRYFWNKKLPQHSRTGGADGAECISRLPCVAWEGDPKSGATVMLKKRQDGRCGLKVRTSLEVDVQNAEHCTQIV